MLTDYTDLEQEIAGAPEPKVLKAGEEVKARIITVRSGISESERFNGCTWYQPVFDVPNDPMVIEFNDFFWELDKALLDAKSYSRSLYQFQQFAASFEVDYSRPFNWEDDLPGKEGWVIVGVKKDEGFGPSNSVKKYIAPKK